MANVPVSVPDIVPRAVVRATTYNMTMLISAACSIAICMKQCTQTGLCVLTQAVCEEGMPPEPITLVKSHRPSEYQ